MIDWTRVDELVDEIGAEDFGEVVELFLEEVEAAIATFETVTDNASAVEEQMHFLKGAGLNLGFDALAKLCLKGEQAAAAGEVNVVSPEELNNTFNASRAHFQEGLPARIAA